MEINWRLLGYHALRIAAIAAIVVIILTVERTVSGELLRIVGIVVGLICFGAAYSLKAKG